MSGANWYLFSKNFLSFFVSFSLSGTINGLILTRDVTRVLSLLLNMMSATSALRLSQEEDYIYSLTFIKNKW